MEHHEIIKKFRLLRNLTQKEVADKLEMTHSGYSKYERGERKMDITKYIQICKVLKAPYNLGGIDDDSLFENYTLDFHMKLQEVVETFYDRLDIMNKEEKNIAREMFEEAFNNIEEEKQRIIDTIQFDNIALAINRFGLEKLYIDK